MRGSDERMGELFSYVDLEERVPKSHPLRLIRRIVNEVLAALDRQFAELYAAEGRPSIAPERLLRALLLQAFYTIRSERQLMEQLHYICSIAGSSVWAWMSQFGYRPCSRRTVTGYLTLLWRASFWPSFSPTKRYECCCRTSTFRSTARRLLHGHRRRVSWRRMVRTNRRPPGATANAIFIASRAAMRRTPLARTPKPSFPGRVKAKRPSSPIRATS